VVLVYSLSLTGRISAFKDCVPIGALARDLSSAESFQPMHCGLCIFLVTAPSFYTKSQHDLKADRRCQCPRQSSQRAATIMVSLQPAESALTQEKRRTSCLRKAWEECSTSGRTAWATICTMSLNVSASKVEVLRNTQCNRQINLSCCCIVNQVPHADALRLIIISDP